MKIREATEEGVVFPAKLDRKGVIIGDGNAEKLAHKIAKEMGRSIVSIYGNFEMTTFVFDRPLSEEEAVEIEKRWA